MSVLKGKRTTSKAEFINTANQIYVEAINFLTRLSARPVRRSKKVVTESALTGGKGFLKSTGCASYTLLPYHDAEPGGMLYKQ